MKPSILLFILCAYPCVGSAGPIVDTKYGKLEGVETEKSKIFYGIPYAGPPTDENRWRPPVEPKSWSPSVRNATFIRAACPQVNCERINPPSLCPNVTAEDCLFMNIFIPLSAKPTSKLAVMLFLHGGNFVHSCGSSLLYDGQYWVNTTNVILVTINYRMGALGFLVTGDKEGDARGNYGYLDQRQALKWINENIQNFGGDPGMVTLFGQSAGAQSTIIHIMSDKSVKYFQKAIIESSPFTIAYRNQAEAYFIGDIFANFLGCAGGQDMTCLRSKTAEEIAIAQGKARNKITSFKLLEAFEPWGPWVDGVEVLFEPIDAFDAAKFDVKMPVLLGTTTEECRIYIYSAWTAPMDPIKYVELVTATKPAHALDILNEYPPVATPDQRDVMTAMSTDFIFGCSSRKIFRDEVQDNNTNIWLYIYDHAFSFDGWGNVTFCQGHVCHGSELPILFHTAGLMGFKYTPAELVLSDQMLAYWTNFAKSGNPNPNFTKKTQGAAPVWPRYSKEGNWPIMTLKTPQSQPSQNFNAKFCDFWDKIGYKEL